MAKVSSGITSVVNFSGEKAAIWGMVSKDQKNRHAQFEISLLGQISRRCLGLAISGYSYGFGFMDDAFFTTPTAAHPKCSCLDLSASKISGYFRILYLHFYIQYT